MQGPLANMAVLRDGRNKRISSYDRTGGNADYIRIEPGETVDIAAIEGAGAITHIWVTTGSKDPMLYRNLILRMYWDGEKHPSVQSPIGDFFGQGWGEIYPYVALPMCASPTRGLNCYLPMPFADGARIEIENDSPCAVDGFYYYVDYEQREVGDEEGRFHAQWIRRLNVSPEDRENEWRTLGPQTENLTDEHNHLFIDAVGRGHYVGMNYYVECPTPVWYGEGDDMFFIDGEKWPPSLHGTGTEDYFNSSHCPKEVYCHPYFGYPRVNDNIGFLGRTHCYRYHVDDPIMFTKSLRGSIEASHANALTLDLITVAYWYQTEPHKRFAKLPSRARRQNMPPIDELDIHRWREAWRQLMGGGDLWGNEPLPKAFLNKIEKAGAKGRRQLAPPSNRPIAKQEQRKYDNMLNRRGRKK